MSIRVEASRVVRLSAGAHFGVVDVRDVLQIHGEALLLTGEAHVRAFDAELLNANHQSADELVTASKTETFVLPVRLVEEDDVKIHRVNIDDIFQLCEDVALVFALLGLDEFEELRA